MRRQASERIKRERNRTRRWIVKAKYTAVYRIIRSAISRRTALPRSLRHAIHGGFHRPQHGRDASYINHPPWTTGERKSLLKLYSSATRDGEKSACGFSEFLAQRARYLDGRSGRVIVREMCSSPLVSMYRYEMADLFSARSLPFSVFQRIDRPSSVLPLTRRSGKKINCD